MNAVLERPSIVLTQDEIIAITGYRQPARQLTELHGRGFHRATLGRDGVVLERAHYEAVCCGAVERARPKVQLVARRGR